MTRIVVLGAVRSGVSLVAHALAQHQSVSLRHGLADPLGEAADIGERFVALAPDDGWQCENLTRIWEVLQGDLEVQAIIVWRQGVDFINSCLRNRADRRFVEHCRLWARSFETAQRLKAAFPERVGLVEYGVLVGAPADIADPMAPGRPLAPNLSITAESLAPFLRKPVCGRAPPSGLDPLRDAHRSCWSMGEVEAFQRICRSALQVCGKEVDLAAAQRMRPVDLGRALFEHGHAFGGMEIVPSDVVRASWKITVVADHASGGAAGLRLCAIGADKRRRFHLTARVGTADRLRNLCLEIVEAVSRRPLFVACGLGRPTLCIDVLLPPHDGWLELAITSSSGIDASGIELDLLTATLSSG